MKALLKILGTTAGNISTILLLMGISFSGGLYCNNFFKEKEIYRIQIKNDSNIREIIKKNFIEIENLYKEIRELDSQNKNLMFDNKECKNKITDYEKGKKK